MSIHYLTCYKIVKRMCDTGQAYDAESLVYNEETIHFADGEAGKKNWTVSKTGNY